MLSENLCHPRHHKRGDRVSGGVERSETVLEGPARLPARQPARLPARQPARLPAGHCLPAYQSAKIGGRNCSSDEQYGFMPATW